MVASTTTQLRKVQDALDTVEEVYSCHNPNPFCPQKKEFDSMFSLFKKKPLSIPPFSDDVMQVERETTRWCQAQIGDYLGTGPKPLPDFGLNHDIMVGSYVCGFMQGQFIVGGQLNRWAKNDEGMMSLGFSMLTGPCLASILGSTERSLAAMDHLPQVGRAKETLAVRQMDNMGGWDGMPHAKGEPKQKNGLLRFYLENNVEQQA